MPSKKALKKTTGDSPLTDVNWEKFAKLAARSLNHTTARDDHGVQSENGGTLEHEARDCRPGCLSEVAGGRKASLAAADPQH